MPIIVRPEPPPPMSVSIAVRVYGSEVLVALIRHFRTHPGTQVQAARTMDLTQPQVSASLKVLIDAGVIVRRDVPTDKRAGHYSVDEQRASELLDALRAYALGD